MDKTKETQNLQATLMEDITQYLRERYVATFEKVDEKTLTLRFVDGRRYMLTVTETE